MLTACVTNSTKLSSNLEFGRDNRIEFQISELHDILFEDTFQLFLTQIQNNSGCWVYVCFQKTVFETPNRLTSVSLLYESDISFVEITNIPKSHNIQFCLCYQFCGDTMIAQFCGCSIFSRLQSDYIKSVYFYLLTLQASTPMCLTILWD